MTDLDRQKWNARYRDGAYQGKTHPSVLLESWIESAPMGHALDVACGAGRNAIYLATQSFTVDAIDISSAALDRGRVNAKALNDRISWIERDLDLPPVLDHLYQLVLLIHYVNLPLVKALVSQLDAAGLFICEQHLMIDEDVAGPRTASFRVQPGELLTAAATLDVLHYSESVVTDPGGDKVALARLVAQAPA
ncbi:MAG: methyltransferase domain-containing protein [Pseudomonadota bacterium]